MNFTNTEQIKSVFKIPHDMTVEKFVSKNINQYYFIKKKSKNPRQIYIPSIQLKTIQKWILKKILTKEFSSSEVAHGFISGRSIVTNAREHLYNEPSWILTMDITNFFDSIRFDSIKLLFIQHGYTKEVSRTFATLCTYRGKLVQGFPTSPFLANLYLKSFDVYLKSNLQKYNVKYTRYADDLTFSGNIEKNYESIILESERMVEKGLTKLQLQVNSKKTNIQTKERKRVTGIWLYKDKLSVSNNYLKKFKREIYYCKKYGVVDHLIHTNKVEISNFHGYMYGKAYFVKMVDHKLGMKLLKELNDLNWPM